MTLLRGDLRRVPGRTSHNFRELHQPFFETLLTWRRLSFSAVRTQRVAPRLVPKESKGSSNGTIKQFRFVARVWLRCEIKSLLGRPPTWRFLELGCEEFTFGCARIEGTASLHSNLCCSLEETCGARDGSMSARFERRCSWMQQLRHICERRAH